MPSSYHDIPTLATAVTDVLTLMDDNIEALDSAISAGLDVTVTAGGTIDIVAADSTRNIYFDLIGSPAADFNLEIPAKRLLFVMKNSSGKTATIRIDGGAGASVLLKNGETKALYSDGTDVLEVNNPKQTMRIQVPASDETSAVSNGTGKFTWRQLGNAVVESVRATLTTANSSGGPITIDLNKNGSTVFTTNLTIDDTEKTSATAAIPYAFNSTPLTVNDGDEWSIDVDSGSNDGVGLKFDMLGYYT